MPPPPAPRKAREPALAFIFVTLFLDIFGIGLIVPILPKLIEELAGAGISTASTLYGLLAAVYSLMQFIFAPVLGSLSDQYGRRPVILASLLGSGLDYLLLAVAPSMTWFFAGRVIAGITGASLTAASAYIADVSPPERRAQNMGLIGAAFGLGFIGGPLLGGLLGHLSLRLPFWVAAALALVNWLYGFFVLPESLRPENRREFSLSRANPVGSLTALGRFPMVAGLAGSFFLISLAQMGLHATWVLYTGYRYGWGPRETGLSLAVVGLLAAIVQGGLVRPILPRTGERRAIVFGLVVSVISYVGYGLATQGWMVYAILVATSIGGIAGPAAQGLISRHVPADEQGAVQGALSSLGSVTGILGPPLATGLFGWFVSERAPFPLPGAPFFLSAALTAAAIALAVRSFRLITVDPK